MVDPVTTRAEGSDAGADRGPAGIIGTAEVEVAITKRPSSEGVGEGEVVETGGGTYGAGGPMLAAPKRLSGCGPKMCANSAGHS